MVPFLESHVDHTPERRDFARERAGKGEQVRGSYYATKHGGESCLGLFIIELNDDEN